jgi:hypothetical protein
VAVASEESEWLRGLSEILKVGRDSVEPTISSAARRVERASPNNAAQFRRCSLRSRLLCRQLGFDGVSPHHLTATRKSSARPSPSTSHRRAAWA